MLKNIFFFEKYFYTVMQELQNYNSLLNTSTGECWLPQKRYSISKAKGEAPI